MTIKKATKVVAKKATTVAKKAVKATTPTSNRISSTKAVELMKNAGRKVITVSCVTNTNQERTFKGKFKGLSNLGYIQIMEPQTKTSLGGMKSINSRNLKELTLSKQVYKIRK